MNEALEFHDSTVETVRTTDETLAIRFDPAYVHVSSGEPGRAPGDGYLQCAELTFAQAKWTGDPQSLVGELSDGSVSINGQRHALLPLPLVANGKIVANLVSVSGATLTIIAASVKCAVSGDRRWLEKFGS